MTYESNTIAAVWIRFNEAVSELAGTFANMGSAFQAVTRQLNTYAFTYVTSGTSTNTSGTSTNTNLAWSTVAFGLPPMPPVDERGRLLSTFGTGELL